MIDDTRVMRGAAHAVLPYLKRRLNGFLAAADHCYVGVTNNPAARLQEHRARRRWDRMVILYDTEWRGSAKLVERSLISWVRSCNHQVGSENIAPGGEGLFDERQVRCVYILLAAR